MNSTSGILINAQNKTPEQLQADMLATQDKLKAKAVVEAEERLKLSQEGWVTIPVPVGEIDIEEIGGDGKSITTVIQPRYVNAYCRLKSKGDPSTMEFRLPLHPEIDAQYEIRNIPALNLIKRGQMSRNLADVETLLTEYSKCRYEEGFAIAKGFHADANDWREKAEAHLADIRYIVNGVTGE